MLSKTWSMGVGENRRLVKGELVVGRVIELAWVQVVFRENDN
jgi:hypothetical protein